MEDRTEQVLNDKIEELEERVSELEEKNRALRNRVESEPFGWSLLRDVKDVESLPLPRLELEWVRDEETPYEKVAMYRLIMEHLVDGVVAIPISETKVSGGKQWPPMFRGKLDLPFRDGSHIHHDSAHLQLPAFARCGGLVEELTSDYDYEHQQKVGLSHRRAGVKCNGTHPDEESELHQRAWRLQGGR